MPRYEDDYCDDDYCEYCCEYEEEEEEEEEEVEQGRATIPGGRSSCGHVATVFDYNQEEYMCEQCVRTVWNASKNPMTLLFGLYVTRLPESAAMHSKLTILNLREANA